MKHEGLTDAHKELLTIIPWLQFREVPLIEFYETRGFTRRRDIPGRKRRLRELMNLGYIHVRTTTYSPWYSDATREGAEQHPAYGHVQIQAMLTDQGLDIATALRNT